MSHRSVLTDSILAAKLRLGLCWKDIAAALGDSSSIIYTAALLGNFPLTADEAEKAVACWSCSPQTRRCLLPSQIAARVRGCRRPIP